MFLSITVVRVVKTDPGATSCRRATGGKCPPSQALPTCGWGRGGRTGPRRKSLTKPEPAALKRQSPGPDVAEDRVHCASALTAWPVEMAGSVAAPAPTVCSTHRCPPQRQAVKAAGAKPASREAPAWPGHVQPPQGRPAPPPAPGPPGPHRPSPSGDRITSGLKLEI